MPRLRRFPALVALVTVLGHLGALWLAHPCACDARPAETEASACCCGPEGGMACHETGAASPERAPAGCAVAAACDGLIDDAPPAPAGGEAATALPAAIAELPVVATLDPPPPASLPPPPDAPTLPLLVQSVTVLRS